MNTDQQTLARIKNNLQMPLIVRDMLICDIAPSADATYALHEILSNHSAENAILCAVMTVQEIMNFEGIISTDISFLHMECERLSERYITRDILAQENPDLWEDSQKEMMGIIAEDIENFLELINLCHMSFEITNPKIAKILDIITTQLQAHLVIVDEVVKLLDMEQVNLAFTAPSSVQAPYTDNIIPFQR